MTNPIDAVLFASFGGPEKQEDVMPFLRNVTRGRGIPDERLEEVSHHYRKLGGRSPINEQNRDLIARLEVELAKRNLDIPIYWGNRNWEPYIDDALQQMVSDGRRNVVAISTSAFSSYSSCRQYREDYARALSEANLEGKLHLQKTRGYFNHPGFLEPLVDGIANAAASLREEGLSLADVELMFSTHSIPLSMASASGPAAQTDEVGWYVRQHEAACDWVVEKLAERGIEMPWQMVYQSRSGAPHIPWLEPDINDVIEELEDRRGIIVVPIGFVTDHIEVIWDLDNEAQETAEEKGLAFRRVATSGHDPRFIAALADLVEEAIDPLRKRVTVTDFPALPEVCNTACCVNKRMIRPTVCGEDSAADRLAAASAMAGR
ncbi:ferrochelatase [Dermabacteraceae bacterium P9123]